MGKPSGLKKKRWPTSKLVVCPNCERKTKHKWNRKKGSTLICSSSGCRHSIPRRNYG